MVCGDRWVCVRAKRGHCLFCQCIQRDPVDIFISGLSLAILNTVIFCTPYPNPYACVSLVRTSWISVPGKDNKSLKLILDLPCFMFHNFWCKTNIKDCICQLWCITKNSQMTVDYSNWCWFPICAIWCLQLSCSSALSCAMRRSLRGVSLSLPGL